MCVICISKDKTVSIQYIRIGTVLHVYDDMNIDRLNVLLAKQNSLEVLAPIGKQNGSSEALWLVHVPFGNASYIADIFRRTPLRLDSLVYSFFQVDDPGF